MKPPLSGGSGRSPWNRAGPSRTLRKQLSPDTGQRMTLATAPETGTIPPRPATRARTVASRLARRPLAVFGLVVIAVAVVAAALAPWIAPYAYDQQLFDW